METLWNGVRMAEGGFRLGTDSVLLAYFAQFPPRSSVAALGAGCGTLGLLLCASDPQIRVTGVELDELKAKAAQLSERYRTIMEERTFWTRRMRRAFPQLGEQLRERMKERLRRDR